MAVSREEPLYLDFAASTPPADEVVDAMMPWLRQLHANPHSDHWHGRRAAEAIEVAREAVADLINASSEDVIFTSGATEANNLALKGLLSGAGPRQRLWLADIEHKSLLESAHALASAGVKVGRIAVNGGGLVDLDAFGENLECMDATAGVVAVGHGNNEIGTVQPVEALALMARRYGHLLHVDATQSAGRLTVDVDALSCDLLALSAHKIYGPGGIGALYVSAEGRREMRPILHGGGQEGGLRSGTVPVFLAVGFGTAARIARSRIAEDQVHLAQLAREFLEALSEARISFVAVGSMEHRLPGHLSLRFPGVDAEDLLSLMAPSLSVSTGAACSAGELRASSVLRALGLSENDASEVIRFTFGRISHLDGARRAAADVVFAVQRARARGS